MTPGSPTPRARRSSAPSWRDVLDLQQQSREEILEALADHRRESKGDHDKIFNRLNALETARERRAGKAEGEARILGFARSSVALVLAGAAAISTVIANVRL